MFSFGELDHSWTTSYGSDVVTRASVLYYPSDRNSRVVPERIRTPGLLIRS